VLGDVTVAAFRAGAVVLFAARGRGANGGEPMLADPPDLMR
jgi:hypothetical protein